MDIKLQDGQVIKTEVTSTDLSKFIELRQFELKMIQDQIKSLTERGNEIIGELSKLITK